MATVRHFVLEAVMSGRESTCKQTRRAGNNICAAQAAWLGLDDHQRPISFVTTNARCHHAALIEDEPATKPWPWRINQTGDVMDKAPHQRNPDCMRGHPRTLSCSSCIRPCSWFWWRRAYLGSDV